MGQSTDGILAYGYDLGDEDMELPAWYDEEWEAYGFEEASRVRLLIAAGIVESYDDYRRDWFAREAEFKAALGGVELVQHCSCDYPMYLLATASQEASRGRPKAVDLTLPEDAGQRLAWAAEVLGLAVSGKPQWLLASNWC